MCFISEPALQNLVVCFTARWKGAVLVPSSWSGGSSSSSGRGSNFYIVRKPSTAISFTVFPSSGSVIATGFRTIDAIPTAVTWFAEEVCDIVVPSPKAFAAAHLFRKCWKGRVVNSTHRGTIVCSGSGDGGRVSACQIADRFKKASDKRTVTVSFRSQFFPGVLVKWADCEGTVNLFNNGSYVLVGVKKRSSVRVLYERLCALIRTHWTTSTPPTSCAWTADSC
jgi:TATA-box binding protein (TBP) (component of TFIID and TFIIIB)